MIGKDVFDCLLVTRENLSDDVDPISCQDVSSLHGAGGCVVRANDVEATVPLVDHQDGIAKVCSIALGILHEGRE